MGFSETSTLPFVELRERVYSQLFGECEGVSHELMPLVPHIDVYVYKPNSERPFYTLISGGMSDLPMNLNKDVDPKCARAEVVLYVVKPEERFIELVGYFARYPHQWQTWFGFGHTVPNGGMPPQPLFDGACLDTMLFMPTIIGADKQLSEKLIIESDPVNLLWAVPITSQERELKLESGMDALLSIFDKVKHPVVLNPKRKSYV